MMPLQRARALVRPRPSDEGGLLDLSRLAGRVTEISEAGFFGAVSGLCTVLAQVQEQDEQVAWVAGASVFFPPDLAYRGLDVEAITVVKAGGLQAADTLLRSGAFGLVVVDWGKGAADEADLGRLARLAESNQTAVVFLTKKPPHSPSLGSQISLRGHVLQVDGGTEWVITRDKRSGPASRQRMTFHGPFGLY